MGKLTGKVAVITGGSTGIGFATAKRFVDEGAEVVIVARDQSKLDDAVKAIGKGVEAFQGDVAKTADIERLRTFVEKKHGRVDIVFANAGMGVLTPFGEVTEEEFDQTIDTNLKGSFFTAQILLPLIPDGGSIIFTSSISAQMTFPTFSVYAATKAALRSLAKSLTTDLKDRKIRVNSVSPGVTATPILAQVLHSDAKAEDFKRDYATRTPLGRTGTPDDIAGAVLYLASDDGSFVTGINVSVDGGLAQV